MNDSSLHWPNGVFCNPNILISDKVQFVKFLDHNFGVIAKNCFPIQDHKDFSPAAFVNNWYSFSPCILVLHSHYCKSDFKNIELACTCNPSQETGAVD